MTTFGRKLIAEAIGSAMLAGVVIGSGVLAERAAGGNIAIALLGNTAATGAILFVLITTIGPVSGAHFNPAVTLVAVLQREISALHAAAYMAMQVAGCIAGAWLAHLMFELPVLQVSSHERSGYGIMLSEVVASFALVFTIRATVRVRPDLVAAAVALVICAGYWWTASTSFANPAITIARALSDTFAGVRPEDVPGFVVAQLVGALLGMAAASLLLPKEKKA